MRKWFLGCMLFLLCLFPNMVLAAEENWVCVGGNLYDITSRGSKVNLSSITAENIASRSTLPQDYFDIKRQFGVNSVEFQQRFGNIQEWDYAFTATSLNRKCNLHRKPDGSVTWTSCPLSDQYSTSKSPYATTKFQSAVTPFQFDGNGRFNLEIKDLFNSTVIVRVVRNGKENTEDYDLTSMQTLGMIGANELYELKSTLRLNFGRNEDIRLEFYINPASGVDCAGAFVGSVTTASPAVAKVNNPWKNAKICQDYRNGYKHVPTSPTNYKALLVPECYNDQVEYFDELPKISEATIREKITEVDGLFVATNDAEIRQLQCHYHPDGSREIVSQTKTFILNPSGSTSSSTSGATGDYWAASCSESLVINYDQPKKVVAGTGFAYNVTVDIVRTCKPFVIRKVIYPEKCRYGISCWGGPYNHRGTGGAGPNEEFDSCVNSCDGGKYSKECVQSCYSKVYEENDGVIQKNVSHQFIDVVKAKQMAIATPDCSTQTLESPNYCYNLKGWKTERGNDDFGRTIFETAATHTCFHEWCYSFHGLGFRYAVGCHGTICYEVYRGYTRPECSDAPEVDWQIEKAKAEAEYDALVKAIYVYENTENFEMSVVDSYKRKDGKPLVTTNTSLENMVKVTGADGKQPGGVVTYEDGKAYKETNGKDVVYTTRGDKHHTAVVEVKKHYEINLPQAVVDQITGQEKYVKTDYSIPSSERDGGNKYYTDINSGTYNDFRVWDTYNGNEGGWTPAYGISNNQLKSNVASNNIAVVFKNLGTVQSANKNGTSYTWDRIDLDCFYGLINKRYIECNDGVCDMDCDTNDVCTGGLQYMFRQIDTSNVFPDRDPRWNWKYTSERDAYGYASEPKKVTEETEAIGDNVYSNEHLDYNITITKENIRAIRRYNKELGNYQNYQQKDTTKPNMVCTKRGDMDICESQFLKSSAYVKTFQRNTEIGSND